MEMSGEHLIPASRQMVWSSLIDPAVLRRCIPGCESLERTSANSFKGRVAAKVGPVKAAFSGTLELSDIDAPNGCTLSGSGTGGAAGFVSGRATVRLLEEDGATRLAYTASLTVGGKLAQVGQRLIDGAARGLAGDFFQRFADALGAAAASVPAEAPAAAPAPAPTAAPGFWLGPRPWVLVGATLLLAAALVLSWR